MEIAIFTPSQSNHQLEDEQYIGTQGWVKPMGDGGDGGDGGSIAIFRNLALNLASFKRQKFGRSSHGTRFLKSLGHTVQHTTRCASTLPSVPSRIRSTWVRSGGQSSHDLCEAPKIGGLKW